MATSNPDPQGPPDYTPEGPPTRVHEQASLRLVTAGAIAALVVATGAFAVTALTNTAADGGESPEEVVEALVAAVEAEDLDSVADLLVPGEQEALAGPVFEAIDELIRLGVFGDDLDLSAIQGIDLRVDDLSMAVSPVDDDLVNVHTSATLVAGVDLDQLPLGSALRTLIGLRGALDDPRPEPATEAIDLTIATVRRDGRWYISVFHSVGEHVRLEQGVGPLPAEPAIVPRGADNPDAAVDQLVAAAASLDVAGLIAMVNPDEGEALYRYAPLLLDAVDPAAPAGVGELDGVEYDIDQQGDRARATITAYTLTTTVKGPYGTQVHTSRLVDGCYESSTEHPEGAPEPGGWFEYGPEGSGQQQEPPPEMEMEMEMPPGYSQDDGVVTYCPEETSMPMPMSGIGTFGEEMVLDRVDGRWYVSPASSITAGILDALRDLDSADELLQGWFMPVEASAFSESGTEVRPPEPAPPLTTVTVPDSTP